MATFTWIPDYGARDDRKPRVRKAQYGDGYQQRQVYGINTNPAMWSLTFGNRGDSEAAAISAFLTARAGAEAFDWTPPGGAAAKFVCPEWSVTVANFGATTITAKFEQVFEL